MKNTLAENMLRFGVKNLSELSIKKLQEQDPIATQPGPTDRTSEPGSLQAVWTDPRLKTNVGVTVGELKANPQITREFKFNSIVWENLKKYYGAGSELIGKDVVGWKTPFDMYQKDLLLQESIVNFKIADIYVGKNWFNNPGNSWQNGDQPCIFICSEKLMFKPVNDQRYVGNVSIQSGEYDMASADIQSYHERMLPTKMHLRIVGGQVYLANGAPGMVYKSTYQLVSPLSDIQILDSIKQVF